MRFALHAKQYPRGNLKLTLIQHSPTHHTAYFLILILDFCELGSTRNQLRNQNKFSRSIQFHF